MELQDAVKQKAERPDAAGMGMDGLLSMLEMIGSIGPLRFLFYRVL